MRYANGRRTEALLLLQGAGVLRVTVPGVNDTFELRMEGEHWVDEGGRRVSIEAMLSAPVAMAAPRTMAMA